ncbi:DUF2829 domain-containing protein [Ensifer sp. ENS04]|uniref:Thoeris anti-defense Tad2 family protein n=1 Tax=Ensifer sp. ENS04 TaxID=2769281 RepID=UPI00177C56EA|nr:MW1434 family type I TA system toxin [Ensifer sp. ENS04]MBD9542975.1 DUF2829 domain-containing protein [Ensifer sp. ENS04]
MTYGQAIEAMKRGCIVGREAEPDAAVGLMYGGTPQRYFRKSTPDSLHPYVPTTDDQLAEDWGIVA